MEEIWKDVLQLILGTCACLFPILLLFSTNLRKRFINQAKPRHNNKETYSKCTSPNCVRCQNYAELNHQLKEKFDKFSETLQGDLTRIKKAIDINDLISDEKFEEAKQQPNILFVPGLHPIQPFYSSNEKLAADAKIIANNTKNILQEFLQVFNDFQDGDSSGWLSNSVPSGDWFVFHLYNQGVKVQHNCDKCPMTTAMLENGLPRFMKGSAFGNAAFSVLQPGTHITEHFGPCNVRIRCHLGLLTPSNCWLNVDGVKQEWKEGQCLLFDDSFRHEARHCGPNEPRAVFIVDLWHPDINELEILCLNKLFFLDTS